MLDQETDTKGRLHSEHEARRARWCDDAREESRHWIKMDSIRASLRDRRELSAPKLGAGDNPPDVLRNEFDASAPVWHGAIARLIRATCLHFNLTSAEFVGTGRCKKLVEARRVASYIARRRLGRSFPELGRAMGGRDHTTILHHFRRGDALILTDPKFQKDCAVIEASADLPVVVSFEAFESPFRQPRPERDVAERG